MEANASPGRLFSGGADGYVMNGDAMISCRDVWKLYGPDPEKFLKHHDGAPSVDTVKESGYIPAVVSASLDVMPGEILVLMRLSGSGKSTLVRCLSRLIEPTSGSVHFGGVDLLAASGKELIHRGYRPDVEHASRLDCSTSAPLLSGDRFVDANIT